MLEVPRLKKYFFPASCVTDILVSICRGVFYVTRWKGTRCGVDRCIKLWTAPCSYFGYDLWGQVNEIAEFLKWNEETSGYTVSALVMTNDYGGGGDRDALLRRGIIHIFASHGNVKPGLTRARTHTHTHTHTQSSLPLKRLSKTNLIFL
jgi:hypothetical protein